jgi:SAM-dependent MidA family methyltransferase
MNPGAGAPTSPASLLERLRRAADAGGWVRYDRFVELALYDPEVGYYARRGRRLGPAGDFYTAAHVGPGLGAAFAGPVRRTWTELGRPRSFRIVELGAGEGRLAEGLLGLGSRAPDFPPRGEYVLVERFPGGSPAGVERARAVAPPGWTVTTASALPSDRPFVGLVLANELLDALPFRRFVRREQRWCELGVRAEGPNLREAPGAAVPPDAPLGLPREAVEGATLEISAAAEALLREVGDALAAGRAIFLDYGDAERRWTGAPGAGTFAAYREHRALADPLSAPGESDLSCWVNFDRIRAAARRAGFVEEAFRPQAEAFGAWGIAPILERWVQEPADATERVRRHLAGKKLVFGFDTFFALELSSPARRTAAPITAAER